MNDRTIVGWKKLFEGLEQGSTNFSIDLTSIRPKAPKIQLLNDTSDGVHPYHHRHYKRNINGKD